MTIGYNPTPMDERRRQAFVELNACINYYDDRDDNETFPREFRGALVQACAVLYDEFDEDFPNVDTESWEEIK